VAGHPGEAPDPPRSIESYGPLEIIGGDIIRVPGMPVPPPGHRLGLNGRHVLFLNMDGADTRYMGTNAFENLGIRGMSKRDPVVEIERFAPGLDTEARQKAVLEVHKLVAGWYAKFNIDVVITRPLSGDYTMTLAGGSVTDIGLNPPIVGIASGDCRNSNEINLNHAFSASLGHNVFQTAVTAAHEAGHDFGLGHVNNMRDIMFPSVSMADGFGRGTVTDRGPCNNPPGFVQDGEAYLTDVLGARDPTAYKPGEGKPPTVSFLAPAAGTVNSADVTVAVKAEAELGLDRVLVTATLLGGKTGGHPIAELRPPMPAARVRFSLAGEYLLTAAAYDKAGNVGLAQNKIKVPAPTCAVLNDCTPGQKCQNNLCVTPPPPPPAQGQMEGLRAWGTACNKSSECLGGICAITPVGQICTHYCTPDRFCAVGSLECVDGICLPQRLPKPDPKIGQLGAKCGRKEDCFTGLCSPPDAVNAAGSRYCTRQCDPEMAWSCPSRMACKLADVAGGMQFVCLDAPPEETKPDDKGGCAAAGRQGSPAGLLLLLLPLIALRRRRA
jgi:hypothetical protein